MCLLGYGLVRINVNVPKFTPVRAIGAGTRGIIAHPKIVARGETMTEAMIEAVVSVVLVFSSMRVLYGSWPWEGHKTWYATQRLLPPVEQDEEDISLSPEQIAHAVAPAPSLRKAELANAKSSEINWAELTELAERAAVFGNGSAPPLRASDSRHARHVTGYKVGAEVATQFEN